VKDYAIIGHCRGPFHGPTLNFIRKSCHFAVFY
jgi:hypothetical protein